MIKLEIPGKFIYSFLPYASQSFDFEAEFHHQLIIYFVIKAEKVLSYFWEVNLQQQQLGLFLEQLMCDYFRCIINSLTVLISFFPFSLSGQAPHVF